MAKLRGFVCPNCVGVRLFTKGTRKPKRGMIVRYRQCAACGYKCVTEEKTRPDKTVANTGTPS